MCSESVLKRLGVVILEALTASYPTNAWYATAVVSLAVSLVTGDW